MVSFHLAKIKQELFICHFKLMKKKMIGLVSVPFLLNGLLLQYRLN